LLAKTPSARVARSGPPDAAQLSGAELRRRLLARVEDGALPLGERFSGLSRTSALSCTNPRELLFGASPDVRDVLARAPHTLARFPSERALIELQTRQLALAATYPYRGPIDAVAISMATVAGTVMHNPRFAQCTAVLMGRW
jgi:hypothetical protein